MNNETTPQAAPTQAPAPAPTNSLKRSNRNSGGGRRHAPSSPNASRSKKEDVIPAVGESIRITRLAN